MPQWISVVMSVIFALLWTVSMLPHTIFWRNACYIVGACLGLYVIARNMPLLRQKAAAPIWIICGLFVWILFHYFFIGKNPSIQLDELSSIWKRAALGCVFAIGLGISIGSSARKLPWNIVAIGLFSPTLIYFIKFFCTFIAPAWGFLAPEYLTLFYSGGASTFYLPKVAYVFFCLPSLALALGMLLANLKSGGDTKYFILYVFIIFSVLGLFYFENIKNGFVYSLILLILFLISLFYGGLSRFSRRQWMLIGFFISIIGVSFIYHIKSNDSWRALIADTKVAVQIDQNDAWKYGRYELFPKNEYGQTVSITNYERISWGAQAIRLIQENPLGYGTVLSSFGHLTKEKWPDSSLTQSHSGWLDLTLGIGIPGVLLLIFAVVLAIQNASSLPMPWRIFGVWILVAILILFATTEVSQRVYVETFVWLVALVSALALPKAAQIKSGY